MTTEHVSVPREWLERLSKLDWFNAPKGAAAEICVMAQTMLQHHDMILSRATPSLSVVAGQPDSDWIASNKKPSAPRVVTDVVASLYSADEVDDVALSVYRRSKKACAMLRFLAQRIRAAAPQAGERG